MIRIPRCHSLVQLLHRVVELYSLRPSPVGLEVGHIIRSVVYNPSVVQVPQGMMVYRSEGPKGLVTTNSSFGYPVSITLMRVCRVIFLIIFTSDSTQCNLLSRRYQFFLRKGKKAPPIESRKNIKNAHHTLFVVVVAGGGRQCLQPFS